MLCMFVVSDTLFCLLILESNKI